MPEDCRGLDVSAASADAVAALDHTIRGYTGMAKDTGDRLKAALGADGDMVMGHVLKGYFFMLMATKPLRERAEKALAQAQALADGANPRERRHVAALEAWVGGRTREALDQWESILVDHPLDLLALRIAHHGYFYAGDGQNLRDTVARCLHAWDDDVPDYGFVMGMRAFGLEETHAYDVAIEAGEVAVELEPDNPWAIHAVAHVHEMTDQPAAGIEWITHHEPGWTGCNNFRNHIWWHRALMRLDRGEYSEALAIFDQQITQRDMTEYLDLINDAALLLRLELHGQDVGERWAVLAEQCTERADDHQLIFLDAHIAAGMAGADTQVAAAMVTRLRDASEAADLEDDNAQVAAGVGADAAEALVAYKAGDMERVCDVLEPIRYDLYAMGGSHAQRDLWSMVLLDAAIQAGRSNTAHALAAERLCRLPANAWSQAAFDRAMAI